MAKQELDNALDTLRGLARDIEIASDGTQAFNPMKRAVKDIQRTLERINTVKTSDNHPEYIIPSLLQSLRQAKYDLIGFQLKTKSANTYEQFRDAIMRIDDAIEKATGKRED